MHKTVGGTPRRRKVCRLLLEAGADPNSIDKNGCNPFMSYIKRGPDDDKGLLTTLKLFERYGLDLDYYNELNGNLAWLAQMNHSFNYSDATDEENEQYRLDAVESHGIVEYLSAKGIMPKAPVHK